MNFNLEKKNDKNKDTCSLIRCGSNESKELSKQHTVGRLIATVLYGQWLQQGERAAAVAGGMVSPPDGKKNTQKNRWVTTY